MAAYRFFRNEKVIEPSILDQCLSYQPKVSAQEELYVISDTSQINLNQLQKVIKDKTNLGVLNDGLTLGYNVHGSIVLNDRYESKGISSAMTYARPFAKSDQGKKIRSSNRDNRPIEEKESYRWLLGVKNSTDFLGNPSRLNFIFDREGDIYEMLNHIDEQGSKFTLRIQHNRRIQLASGDVCRINEYIEKQPVKQTYKVSVAGDNRGNKTRVAEIELKYSRVKILAPTHYNFETTFKPYLEVSIVKAKEVVKPNEKSPDNYISWKIITNSAIESIGQAKKVIEIYSSRWCIEDVFRVMKNKGLQLDSVTLENGKALRKIAIMAFDISSTALQLRQARDGKNFIPIQEIFNDDHQQCMKQLCRKLEGNTVKQQNPHDPNSLAWAAWIIARLGGWSGYASQRPPGIVTMKRGMESFSSLFLGWSIRQP